MCCRLFSSNAKARGVHELLESEGEDHSPPPDGFRRARKIYDSLSRKGKTWRSRYSKKRSTVPSPLQDNLPLSSETSGHPQINSSTTTLTSAPAMSSPSDIIDLEDDQESPPVEFSYDPEIPFRFMDLDAAIRQRILRLVLVKQDPTAPYYNCCSLMAAAHLVENENVDLSVLSVCKKLTEEASSILYGENMFLFKEPRVASWWLDRIGGNRVGSNVFKVRRLAFNLNAGDTEPFNVLKETLWVRMFLWLSRVQRLDEIWLSFSQWRPFDIYGHQGLNDLQIEQATRARNLSIHHLQGYRGLKKVWIKGGWILGPVECEELANRMKSPRIEALST